MLVVRYGDEDTLEPDCESDMTTATPATSRAQLDKAMMGGLAWSAASRWLSQIFRWGATILTARLLLPSDYGIVGMATVLIGLLQNVAEFGFGSAIVQQRELSKQTVREIGGAALLIAICLALATSALSPLVVRFFDEKALIYVIPVMSLRFIIDALATVPRATLSRDLRFQQLSIIEGIESLVMAAVTVGLAWLTHSYWCFIVSNLVSGIVFAALANAADPHMPKLPHSFAGIKAQVKFGRDVVLGRMAWYTYTNADFAVVGHLMSKVALGYYSMGWNIASVPADKFSGLVLRVAPSILSAARTQPGEMRRYYLMLVRGVALITFPLAFGLALVSEGLVNGVLGAKWAEAINPMRLLSLFFAVRSIAALAPVVIISRCEPHVDRNYNFLFALVLPALFAIATRWGITGVAAAWLIAYPVLFAMLPQRYVLRTLEISAWTFAKELWPATSSAIAMTLPVLAVDHYLPHAVPALVRLALMTVVGGLTYAAMMRVFHRSSFDGAIRLVRNRGLSAAPSVTASTAPSAA